MEEVTKAVSILNINSNIYIEKITYHKKIADFNIYVSRNTIGNFTSVAIQSSEEHITLVELEGLMIPKDFHLLLHHILISCEIYDQVNPVFSYISKIKDIQYSTINSLLEDCLHSTLIKQSFVVNRLMLAFIVNNSNQISNEMYQRIIKEFPHYNGVTVDFEKLKR